jgi:hypothetical protein
MARASCILSNDAIFLSTTAWPAGIIGSEAKAALQSLMVSGTFNAVRPIALDCYFHKFSSPT